MSTDTDKKQILLRLSKSIWEEINRWAEDDFRSVNGQIEYILAREISKRRNANHQNDEEQ